MDFNLARGVDLHIIPTKQFKMNHVLIDFATPQTPTNATARNLLANLLETSTHRYPTQTALARQLASLYGAYVNLYVNRLGTLHTVRLRASFVNNRFVDEDLFVMKVSSFGQIADLENLNAKSLVSMYHSMINEDKIDIFVLGDIDPMCAQQVVAKLPFKDRDIVNKSPLYHQALYDQVQRKTEYQQVNQAKLNLAYSLPVYYHDADYYAGLVFNGLFGGTPYSKLFTNVREKASLAYYASSRLLPFNGIVSVQTGIQASDQEKVQNMIQEQLTALQNGDFTTETLSEVQDSLINQYRAGHDLASNVLEQQLVTKLVNESDKNFVTEIKKVTVADVMRVAKQMKLQAVYLLSGEK